MARLTLPQRLPDGVSHHRGINIDPADNASLARLPNSLTLRRLDL